MTTRRCKLCARCAPWAMGACATALILFLGLARVEGQQKAPAKAAAKPPAAAIAPEQPAGASAATYLKLPVVDAEKRNRVATQGILRQPTLTPEQRTAVEAYYKQYALPRWTLPANEHEVWKYRNDHRRELDVAKAGEAFPVVLDLTLAFIKHVLDPQKNYSPVVKCNAVLLLAELDGEIAAGSSRGTPLPAALPLLLEALQNPQQSDGVRVGALQGIVRHAGSPTLDPQVRNAQLIPAMLDLINSAAPRGRSPEGHNWMRAMAIQALAATRQAGANGANALVLAGIVSDSKERLSVRLAAARALGLLDYSNPGTLKPLELAGPLAQLILECHNLEIARDPVLSNPSGGAGATGMMGMMMGGMPSMSPMGMTGVMGAGAKGSEKGANPADMMKMMMGGAGKTGGKGGSSKMGYPGMGAYPGMGLGAEAADETDPNEKERIEQFRRRYKTELTAVYWGLIGTDVVRPNDAPRGLAALTSGKPEAKFVADVVKNIQDQVKAMDKEAKKFKEVTDQLKTPISNLAKLVADEPGAAVRRPASGGAAPAKTPAAPVPAGASTTAAPAGK